MLNVINFYQEKSSKKIKNWIGILTDSQRNKNNKGENNQEDKDHNTIEITIRMQKNITRDDNGGTEPKEMAGMEGIEEDNR